MSVLLKAAVAGAPLAVGSCSLRFVYLGRMPSRIHVLLKITASSVLLIFNATFSNCLIVLFVSSGNPNKRFPKGFIVLTLRLLRSAIDKGMILESEYRDPLKFQQVRRNPVEDIKREVNSIIYEVNALIGAIQLPKICGDYDVGYIYSAGSLDMGCSM